MGSRGGAKYTFISDAAELVVGETPQLLDVAPLFETVTLQLLDT